MMTSGQQIKYGALLSYTGIVLYILIGLLYTPWMIRCIGQAEYGLYTLAYSIITFFAFDFGISAAVQRFVAKYLAEGSQEKVNQCLSIVYRLYIYIDITIFAVLAAVYFLIPAIYRELTPDQMAQFKTIYIIASLFSVISFPFITLNGILSAYEKFVQLKICDLMAKVCTVLTCVICLWFGHGLYALVLTNAIVGLVIVAVKFIITKKETDVKVKLSIFDRPELKRILSFSGWTMVVALCQRCIFSLAPSILGYYESASAIAILGIAISLEAYNYTFAYALNGLFLPKISRILNDTGNVLPLMIRVGRIQIFIIGLVLICFTFVGKNFITVWVGDGYSAAYVCTLLFIIPAFFLLPADVADQTLIASGNVKYRAMVYVIMAAVNLVISFIFTRIWGLLGLAWSIFIAYMVRNACLYYVYFKRLHINVFTFFHETYFKMVSGIIVSAIPAIVITHYITLSDWPQIIVSGGVIAVSYIILMFAIALNREERQLILSPLQKLCRW